MNKTIIGLLICMAFTLLSHAQAKLPFSPAASSTKDEQEILNLSTTKWK